jgi:hypothetical protein
MHYNYSKVIHRNHNSDSIPIAMYVVSLISSRKATNYIVCFNLRQHITPNDVVNKNNSRKIDYYLHACNKIVATGSKQKHTDSKLNCGINILRGS